MPESRSRDMVLSYILPFGITKLSFFNHTSWYFSTIRFPSVIPQLFSTGHSPALLYLSFPGLPVRLWRNRGIQSVILSEAKGETFFIFFDYFLVMFFLKKMD
jgi:hypothetical protein